MSQPVTLDRVNRTYWVCGDRPSDWPLYRGYVAVARTVAEDIVAVAVAVADKSVAVDERRSASYTREKSHSEQG
jgi:hypothetical protein